MNNLDHLCVNTLRFLAVDAVEQAHSGHPGLPLGAAPMAYVLWDRFLRHNPRNPGWFNRDRFILSAGHGSALLYALLHVYGYDLPLEELKRFRQWGSKTPGHPEYGHTPGVEATTGPLGQGFAMGVGMAMAECALACEFNQPGFPVVDHYTYGIVSDGDLMEGIASEAASLAGTWRLGKLIYLYDDNHITIEGETDLAFTEDVRCRFEAYGWQVLIVPDGNDLAAIEVAIQKARGETERPSLVIVRTHIGYGSPKQDTAAVHGEPLGPEALRATKEALGWPLESPFYIPDEALAHFRRAVERGARLEREWQALLDAYRKEHPDRAARFEQLMCGDLPADWDADLPVFRPEQGPMATRTASGKAMNALARRVPTFMGGSADLAPSTRTVLIGYGDFGLDEACGRNVHFGVREHAMGAIVNGMALHGGRIPYAATFLVFSDYMRAAIRLAALMQTHVIFIFTHDSIALGEDGPTHQPVEHLMSLRAIPGLTVLRPADANETVAAWRIAIERRGPMALALTRQNVPVLDPHRYPIAEGVPRGAYVLVEAENGHPDIILIATGSEVHLALAAREQLALRGVHAHVVSMPSWELFDEQPAEYRERVLRHDAPKLAVEAGITRGWRDYVGDTGDVIGLDRFGASAPGDVVLDKLGFNVEHIVHRALALLGR
ncbi:Transketolase [bacterium HR10]|uniref:Transketolase n=1 Tax=uncultured Acidobacteriota bacterium TaxID=171953 RepID=H5SG42_9BACT|nr:transketolase [uncultured Acidobacteriota bacterium]GBC81571.1 Transketolase [bacterium HR10]